MTLPTAALRKKLDKQLAKLREDENVKGIAANADPTVGITAMTEEPGAGMYGSSLNLDIVDAIDEDVTSSLDELDKSDDTRSELATPSTSSTMSTGRIESDRDAKRSRPDLPTPEQNVSTSPDSMTRPADEKDT